MIAIVDYGMGNIGSIKNMIKRIGGEDVCFARSAKDLSSCDKYILPGVGKFDAGMQLLNDLGIKAVLDEEIIQKNKPVLGICLGMQMLGVSSDEGTLAGLGYIDFNCVLIDSCHNSVKVPHMGWDYVTFKQKDNPVLSDDGSLQRFYFVHSYHAVCKNEDDIWMTCDYGTSIVAGVHRGNIYGTQFHPEKSHRFGMKILEGFMRL